MNPGLRSLNGSLTIKAPAETDLSLREQRQLRGTEIEKRIKQQMINMQPQRVVVMGGGISGCFTALELANCVLEDGKTALYEVILIEKNKDLLIGTSNITPGRLGLGFHYAHFETAAHYMEQTLAFMQHFPDCKIGHGKAAGDPLHHGRYAIMKDSIPAPDEVFQIYKMLQQKYQALVTKDKRNKLFGEPEDFLKVLYVAPDLKNSMLSAQYRNDSGIQQQLENTLNLTDVAVVVETPEELLNWTKCRDEIIKKINNQHNISVWLETEATELAYHNDQFTVAYTGGPAQTDPTDQFTVTYTGKSIQTDYLVNACWQNAEQLNATLNLAPNDHGKEERTNRLKSIITIELPEALKNANSVFFCMGSYAMFSNLGNGTGKVTFAPATNMAKSDATIQSDEIDSYLAGKATKAEIDKKGQDILQGASQYIPALKDATITHIGFGIVKTRGSEKEVSIDNPNGKISERDYGWVETYVVDPASNKMLIQNCSMKLTYSLSNAEEVKFLINEMVYDKYLKNKNLPSPINYLNTLSISRLLAMENNELLWTHTPSCSPLSNADSPPPLPSPLPPMPLSSVSPMPSLCSDRSSSPLSIMTSISSSSSSPPLVSNSNWHPNINISCPYSEELSSSPKTQYHSEGEIEFSDDNPLYTSDVKQGTNKRISTSSFSGFFDHRYGTPDSEHKRFKSSDKLDSASKHSGRILFNHINKVAPLVDSLEKTEASGQNQQAGGIQYRRG